MGLSDLRAQWYVLAEDRQQQNFIYHWLVNRGVERGKIDKLALPAGRGAGEQYVRLNYRREVEQIRRRSYLKLVLVVVIDADTGTLDERVRELDEQVERQADERVVLAIPRRNIETWIHYLCSPTADEVTDYKPKTASECHEAARKLASLREAPEGAPDSLQRFFQELRRVG